MKTMQAVCIYAYGGPEVLVLEDAPRPHPGPGDVLVRVHAAGINPVDWKIREGHLQAMLHHTLPLVLGWDVSGTVETLGTGVTRFAPGDEVFGKPDINRDGAYAEYIVVREAELAPKPRSLDHLHAAALPLAGLTAWQALFDAGGLVAGQRVLIHSAAGGVGTIAVQLAKWKGAHVIGTASEHNRDFLLGLGADQVVDHRDAAFTQLAEPVDLVLDTMGGDTQARSWPLLKRGGMLVSIGSPPSAETAAAHGVRSAFIFTQPNARQLGELARLADSGQLKAVVETVLPLAEARRGQELNATGHTRGKIVLRVG